MERIRQQAARLKEIAHELQGIEIRKSELNKEKAQLISELSDEMMEQGVEKVNFEFGLLKAYEPKLRLSIKKEDKPRFYQWLRDNGLGAIIKEEPSVHAATLSATMKEEILNGREVPEYVNVFWQPDVRVL